MKRILAFVLSALLAFGGIAAAAEGEGTDSFVNTTRVTVELAEPLPDSLGLGEEFEKALSDFGMTFTAKLDFSDETSFEGEIHSFVRLGQETKEATGYFWTHYTTVNDQAGLCIAGKADSDLRYGYSYIPLDTSAIYRLSQISQNLDAVMKNMRNSLERRGFEEQNGIYVDSVSAEEIGAIFGQMDLSSIGWPVSVEGMAAQEQIIALLQSGIFAEEAVKIEAIPSADDAYVETVRISLNFDVDIQKAADILGQALPEDISGNLAFSVVIENTTDSLGFAAVTLPEFTQENTYWVGAEPIHALYLNNSLAGFQTALLQTPEGGVTMVPAIAFLETFGIDGGDIFLDADTNSLTIAPKWSGVEVEMTPGEKEARVNGEVVSLLAAPADTEGDVMVPLRFLAESLGLSVEYLTLADPLGYQTGGRVNVYGNIEQPLKPVRVMAPNDLPQQVLTLLEQGGVELSLVDQDVFLPKSNLVLAAGEDYLLLDNGKYPEETMQQWIMEYDMFMPLDQLLEDSENFAEYLMQNMDVKESLVGEDGQIYRLPLEVDGKEYRIYVPTTFRNYDKLVALADYLYAQ